jgi:hypothetical protein
MTFLEGRPAYILAALRPLFFYAENAPFNGHSDASSADATYAKVEGMKPLAERGSWPKKA